MATLNENINAIKEVKENIKNALIAKNVDMAGVAFTSYPQKIEGLSFEILFNACKTRNGDQATAITITTGRLPRQGTKIIVSYTGYNDGSDTRPVPAVILYGSNDGTEWTEIGTVPGASLSSSNRYYDKYSEFTGSYFYYKTSNFNPNLDILAITASIGFLLTFKVIYFLASLFSINLGSTYVSPISHK